MRRTRSAVAFGLLGAAAAFAPPVSFAQRGDDVTIEGPAPPAPPDVIARDADGRVTIRAVRLAEPLRVDGRLDEIVYESVPSIGGFVQMEPDHGAPATEPTEVWIFFDDDMLYVAARCHDSQPEDRWVANEMRRDSMNVVRNENFAIFFDTFYDRRNAFLFEISPIGGIYDAHVMNERPGGNIDWNPVWDRQAGRFEGGWTAEMAIPFKSLRYRPGRTQVWGINIRRTVRWKNEESFVVPLPATSGSAIFQISRGGTLVGLEVPPGSRNLELKPYAISSLTTDRLASPPVTNKGDGDVGFDVKYGVTQNLTADFTYNTDFAQVEVDEQQVNLTRFNLFFPEKREFFLEGQGIFEFGGAGGGGGGGGGGLTPTLFYSRRIGLNGGRAIPIDAGGRLTGKIGKFTVGLLNVQTAEVPAEGSRIAAPATNFAVVRVRRDILRRSSVGALYTRRSIAANGSGPGESYGVDLALGFFDYLNFTAYLAQTSTPGVEGDDTSYRTQLNYNGDRYGVQAERLVVGDGFSPEIGFVRRDDFARNYGSFRFSPRPSASRRVRKYSWQTSFDYLTDGDERLETREVGTSFGVEFQNSDTFFAGFTRSYERLDEPFRIAAGVAIPVDSYGFQGGVIGYSFGNQRRAAGSLSIEHGGFYGGDRTALSFRSGRIELTPRFSTEPSLSLNWVDLPYGRFTTALAANRATFTVTPRMLFSALLQYNSSNTTLGSNVRFRWEYHPGSELFVVYTDERDTALRGIPGTENRALVVKINRLMRF